MTKGAFVSPELRVRAWTGPRRGMHRVASLVLLLLLPCAPTAGLMAQDQMPGANIPVTVIDAKGDISGTVSSSSGRLLRGITMQLVNPSGAIVGTAVTANDGRFQIPGMDFGRYTLQCVSRRKVVGTSSVTLAAPRASARMICAADPGYWEQWGVLTLLVAAGTAVGATAFAAAGGVASPSQ